MGARSPDDPQPVLKGGKSGVGGIRHEYKFIYLFILKTCIVTSLSPAVEANSIIQNCALNKLYNPPYRITH